MALLTRSAVADYLNIGTKANKVWALCGTGFNSLDESPNAQVESKVYIHEDEASPSITRYESSFGFDTDVWNDQEAVMLIYEIARNRKVGSNALVEYLRTDFKVEEDGTPITTIVPARLFTCAVEVSDIQGGGGETLTMSGNLNVVGKFIDGTFNLETLTFDDDGELPEKQVKVLTVTIKAGESGKVKVDVNPNPAQNNKYLYKVYDASPEAPDYNDHVFEGWSYWDGADQIAVEAGKYLAVAEVSNANMVKGFGSVQNPAAETGGGETGGGETGGGETGGNGG